MRQNKSKICFIKSNKQFFQSYSEVGKRCVIKTTSQEVFKKYTAIFAINNMGII